MEAFPALKEARDQSCPGEDVSVRHLVEQLQSSGLSAIGSVSGNHSSPADEILLGNCVEHLPSVNDGAALGVHVYERRLDDVVVVEQRREEVGVDLLAETKGAGTGAGLREGGEDESVGRNGVRGNHAAEVEKRIGRAIRVGEGGEEGGIEDGVPVGGFVEQPVGVRQEAGFGVGIEESGWVRGPAAHAGLDEVSVEMAAGGGITAADGGSEERDGGGPR